MAFLVTLHLSNSGFVWVSILNGNCEVISLSSPCNLCCCTHKDRLNEAIIISTHNIYLYGEPIQLFIIYHQISSNTHLICSTAVWTRRSCIKDTNFDGRHLPVDVKGVKKVRSAIK